MVVVVIVVIDLAPPLRHLLSGVVVVDPRNHLR